MWTTLALSAAALLPERQLQRPATLRNRIAGSINDRRDGATEGAANGRIEAALLLALESDTGGVPDFLFDVDPATGAAPVIWHPDQSIENSLDKQALSESLRRILSSGLADTLDQARQQSAGTTPASLRNMEFDWTDPAGREQCWQVSISARSNLAGGQLVTGLVRDIGMARSWCADIDHELLDRPRQAASCQAINQAISGHIRDQAFLVSSICELLLEPSSQDAEDVQCQRRQFGSDVKSAVAGIVSTADLLCDLTDASFGQLQFNLQRWQLSDIAAHALPGVRRLLEPAGAHLVHVEPDQPHALVTDIQRLSRLIQMMAALLVPAIRPGTEVRMVHGASSQGGAWLSLVYEGSAIDLDPDASDLKGLRPGILHPAMTIAYRHQVLAVHRGELRLTDRGSGVHELLLALNDAQVPATG